MSPQVMTPTDGLRPHEPITQTIQIEKPPSQDVAKWIGLLLTFIGMIAGIIVWETNEHSSIREWTAEQDFVTKTELKEVMKDSYVPLHKFTELKQKLEDQNKKMDDMSIKIDKLLDEIHRLSRGRRGR